MTITADKIALALRPIAPQGKLLQEDIPLINQLAALWDTRPMPGAPGQAAPHIPGELPWIANARSKLGRKEIVGPTNNKWIAEGWAKLKAGWFNDDETPWCGFFVADCLNDVGLPYPKNFPSAASFATYGTPCSPRMGAIGVKARVGGNHVFFIVGETADKLYYKALGGNQGNMVSIMDIRKSDVNHIRWPQNAPPDLIGLPVCQKGTVSRNEA